MSEIVLRAPHGANKTRKRLGRGVGSGLGKTSGKGHKGQNARSGGGVRPGFEGGQMPIYRRLASRGFSNYPFKKIYRILNVSDLEAFFNDGDKVDFLSLKEKRLVKKGDRYIKILGNGDLTKKLEIVVSTVSVSAKEKIEKAGGKVAEQSDTKENR